MHHVLRAARRRSYEVIRRRPVVWLSSVGGGGGGGGGAAESTPAGASAAMPPARRPLDGPVAEDRATTRPALVDAAANDESVYKSMVEGCTDRGFVLNGVEAEGSVLVLPRSFLLWKPRTYSEITVESLSLLPLVDPPLEFLIIGCGEENHPPAPELVAYFREHGISVEQMNTASAIGLFNILSAEDRLAAAALIFPRIFELEKVRIDPKGRRRSK